jgi:hypothetical protein
MSSKGKKEEDKLNALFNEFTDEDDSEVITSEGIEKICNQVGISDSSEDVRALVLCWKLGAYSQEPFRPGCIKRTEFCGAMKTMRKDSVKVS